jgi:hypothetical protein
MDNPERNLSQQTLTATKQIKQTNYFLTKNYEVFRPENPIEKSKSIEKASNCVDHKLHLRVN